MARSPFHSRRRLVYVAGGLTGPLGRIDVRFVVDTGSAVTLVRPSIIERAGYFVAPDAAHVRVRSATGEQRVPTLAVGLDCLGHTRAMPVGVNVFSGRFWGDGVIGLDFFADGRLTIDTAAGWIEFRPRSSGPWWRPWG